MRTTIVIDEDVLDRARAVATSRKKPFRSVINEAMREGLTLIESKQKQKPYRMKPRNMGQKSGISIDNIQELLSRIEGEDFK
jgi:hypothetical protein